MKEGEEPWKENDRIHFFLRDTTSEATTTTTTHRPLFTLRFLPFPCFPANLFFSMLRHEAADVLQVPAQATQDEVSTRERKERERKVLSPVQSKRRRRRFFFISQPRPPTPFSLNPHTHSDRSAAPTSPRPAGPTPTSEGAPRSSSASPRPTPPSRRGAA